MKKFFLSLALVVVASLGMANASTNVLDNAASSYGIASVNAVDGDYNGIATPTKMNGQTVKDPTPVSATFTVTNGILEGSVAVATANHSFKINTVAAITGPGTYAIQGSFKVSDKVSLPLNGNIVVTSVDGIDLEFVCTAYIGGAPATESVFSFSTK